MKAKTRFALVVTTCFVQLMVLNSCFVPWFPSDPHKDAIELLQSGEATRDTLIDMIGAPDFSLDESSYVWVGSKPDLYLAAGYNLGGAINERDFILAVDFDSSSKVVSQEIRDHSGSHDFCFGNGICFTPRTLNVPLAPDIQDLKAKEFNSDPGACIVYFYRDMEGAYEPEDDYVHINLYTESFNSTDSQVIHLPHFSVASVPGGFFYWLLPAPVNVSIQALYDYPWNYKFGLSNKADRKRFPDHLTFECDVDNVMYVRLFVPEKRKFPSELDLVSVEQAQDTIMDLRLVLKLGQGGP